MKRDHFIGLCELNESRVRAWTAMDRSPHVDPCNKRNVLSVYTHNPEKGGLLDDSLFYNLTVSVAPTLKALVERLMSSKDTITVTSGDVKVGAAVAWLQEGLGLAQLQCVPCYIIPSVTNLDIPRARIRHIAKTCKAKPTAELRSRRTKLLTCIDKWHKEQTRFMRSITPQLVGYSVEEPEDQCLFLPSDFSVAD